MTLQNLSFETEQERDELIEKNEKYFYGVPRFNFLKAHRGLRPGLMHLLIGETGRGKSTLTRSILFDLLRNKVNCFWFSTEETHEQMRTMIAQDRELPNELLKNVSFFHERDMKNFVSPLGISKFLEQVPKIDKLKVESRIHDKELDQLDMFKIVLQFQIKQSGAQVVFFDNITTSLFYDPLSPAHQTKMICLLKEICIELDMPMVVVAHFGKSVNSSLQKNLTASHVRGSNTSAGTSEIAYVYQAFVRKNEYGSERIYSFIDIDKCRLHSAVKKKFILIFDHTTKLFGSDKQISHEEFDAIFDKGKK